MAEQDHSWIKPGAKAVSLSGYAGESATIVMIERLTATQVVTDKGRYRLSNLRAVGEHTWTPTLHPLTEERAQNALARQMLDNLLYNIDKLRRQTPRTISEVAECMDLIAGKAAVAKARLSALGGGVAEKAED